MTLGATLRALRSWQGMTQSELATQLGCSSNYVSHVERGQRLPSLQWIRRVLEVLGDTDIVLSFLKDRAEVTLTIKWEDTCDPKS